MKRIMVVCSVGILLCLMAACGSEQPDNGEVALTMIADKLQAEATQAAVNSWFTATAQIQQQTAAVQTAVAGTQIAVTATQQARNDAEATQMKLDSIAATDTARADAEATAEQGRRDAIATAEQGREDALGTAAADATATWFPVTMAAMPTSDWLTAQNSNLEIEIKKNEKELGDLEVDQQREKNTAEWVVPFLIALGVATVFAVVQIRRSRVTKIENEEDGTIEGVLIDGATLIRPQLMPGPVLDLSGKTATAPDVTDPETQREVTRRAQAVEALKAMPTQAPTPGAATMANSVFGESKPPVVEILPAGQLPRTILDEMSDQVVEEE